VNSTEKLIDGSDARTEVLARKGPVPEPAPRRPRVGTRVPARVRILGWLLFVMALAMLAVGVAVRTILLADVERDTAVALEQEIGEFSEFAATGRDPDDGLPFGNVADLLQLHLQRQYPDDDEILFGYTDRLLRQERSGPGDLVADAAVVSAIVDSPDSVGSTQTSEGEVAWAKQVAEPSGGGQAGTFAIGILVDRERADVSDTVRVVIGVSLMALLFTGGIAWVVAGQILAPVRLVRRTAAQITTDDLSRRIEVDGRDDVAELADTFNDMLDRLESAFAAQRQFVDDASHELRTPITIVLGHLELMGDDPREREETVRLVTDELDRMNRIVEDLLLLAKAERPDFVHKQPVDLETLTRDIDAKVRALADRDWILGHVGTGSVRVDPQRVTQAVLQLAQNAVSHTGPGDRIVVGSELALDRVLLWVSDTGPGVSSEDAPTIFERFARGTSASPRSDNGGAGLGLSIVRAIADGHHGAATLDSRPGAGATFGLDLPAR
jgi:two-component system OmpR family sensor kinase